MTATAVLLIFLSASVHFWGIFHVNPSNRPVIMLSPFELTSSWFLSARLSGPIVATRLDTLDFFFNLFLVFLPSCPFFDPIGNFLDLRRLQWSPWKGLIIFAIHRFLLHGLDLLSVSYNITLIDLHKMDKLFDWFRTLGVKILTFLHFLHLVMKSGHYWYEFLLFRLLSHIKLDDSLLEDVKKGVDAVIIGLLLETSRKSWIYWHLNVS